VVAQGSKRIIGRNDESGKQGTVWEALRPNRES
jgi:hypothetical protein